MIYNLKIFTLLMISILTFSCMDIDVENLNEPDASDALQSPGDVESLIAGSFKTFHNATESWDGPNGLSVLADELTCSWGNAAMKDLSSEPRQAYTNDDSYIDIWHIRQPWTIYSAISSVNDGLSALVSETSPVVIGVNGRDTQRAIAMARFIQGISYCYLGSFFDQAYIVDENTDLEGEIGLSSHQEVTAKGIEFLEDCITICNNNEFTVPPVGWLNGLEISNDYLARVCHSYIARNLACSARTPAERTAVSATEIIAHVDQGLLNDGEDFGIEGDFGAQLGSNPDVTRIIQDPALVCGLDFINHLAHAVHLPGQPHRVEPVLWVVYGAGKQDPAFMHIQPHLGKNRGRQCEPQSPDFCVDGGIVNGDAAPPLLGGAATGSGAGHRSDGAGRKKRGESEKKEEGEKEFHKPAVKRKFQKEVRSQP